MFSKMNEKRWLGGPQSVADKYVIGEIKSYSAVSF